MLHWQAKLALKEFRENAQTHVRDSFEQLTNSRLMAIVHAKNSFKQRSLECRRYTPIMPRIQWDNAQFANAAVMCAIRVAIHHE
jgi:hypothetical protein